MELRLSRLGSLCALDGITWHAVARYIGEGVPLSHGIEDRRRRTCFRIRVLPLRLSVVGWPYGWVVRRQSLASPANSLAPGGGAPHVLLPRGLRSVRSILWIRARLGGWSRPCDIIAWGVCCRDREREAAGQCRLPSSGMLRRREGHRTQVDYEELNWVGIPVLCPLCLRICAAALVVLHRAICAFLMSPAFGFGHPRAEL